MVLTSVIVDTLIEIDVYSTAKTCRTCVYVKFAVCSSRSLVTTCTLITVNYYIIISMYYYYKFEHTVHTY
jgi:hypothetical protein